MVILRQAIFILRMHLAMHCAPVKINHMLHDAFSDCVLGLLADELIIWAGVSEDKLCSRPGCEYTESVHKLLEVQPQRLSHPLAAVVREELHRKTC